MEKNILRMSMFERFKYLNEEKRKKFNTTPKENKNNERK